MAAEAMQPLMSVEAGQHGYAEVKQAMLAFQGALHRLSGWKRRGGSSTSELCSDSPN
jgi:hypothetical protein